MAKQAKRSRRRREQAPDATEAAEPPRAPPPPEEKRSGGAKPIWFGIATRDGEPIQRHARTVAWRVLQYIKSGTAKAFRDSESGLVVHLGPDGEGIEDLPSGKYLLCQTDEHGRAVTGERMGWFEVERDDQDPDADESASAPTATIDPNPELMKLVRELATTVQNLAASAFGAGVKPGPVIEGVESADSDGPPPWAMHLMDMLKPFVDLGADVARKKFITDGANGAT